MREVDRNMTKTIIECNKIVVSDGNLQSIVYIYIYIYIYISYCLTDSFLHMCMF